MKKQTTPKPKKDKTLKYEKPLNLDMSFKKALKLIVDAGVPPKELKAK